MTCPGSLPSPRDIQRWSPTSRNQIVGNTDILNTLANFSEQGPANLLVTGPSRSGKTRTIKLAIRALCCPFRLGPLDPCGQCQTCRDIGDVRGSHVGLFAGAAQSTFGYIAIDAETVSKNDLLALANDVEANNSNTLIYIDEVRAMESRGLVGTMLKVFDESPATFLASAITTKGPIWTGRRTKIQGIPEAMLARFLLKGTSLAAAPEVTRWMIDRSVEWHIPIVDPEITIPLVLRRTGHRVGYILHFFATAASTRERRLTSDIAKNVNLTSPD